MKDKYRNCLSNLSYTSSPLVTCDSPHFTKHSHEHFEIYVLVKGKCCYSIDETIYSVLPGDIVLIPACHTHKIRYDTPTHSRRLLYISNTSLPPYTEELIEKTGYIFRNAKVVDEINLLMEKINEEYLHPNYYSSCMVAGYLQIMWGLLLRNHNYYTNEHVYSNTYIPFVLKYIHANYSSDITLGQVAEQCSITPEYLSRIFKSEMGMTFNHYLTSVRMKEAEILLMQTNISVAEIAFTIGYNDSNYFTNKFKKIYNISPTQFRNQHRTTTK